MTIDVRLNFSRYSLFLAVAWTLLISVFFSWESYESEAMVRDAAIGQARAYYRKDLALRKWAAEHSSIYVPVTEFTQPDALLAAKPDWNIKTPSGESLTLVSPATITSQIKEWFGGLNGVTAYVVSTNPKHPKNQADAWEGEAISGFKTAQDEVVDFVTVDGEPSLRLIRPAIMEEGCLACHGSQGYQLGDIGGGIALSLPMSAMLNKAHAAVANIGLGLLIIWALGIVAIYFTTRQLREKENQRVKAIQGLVAAEARKGALLDSALDAIVTLDAEGLIVDFNPAAEEIFGYQSGRVIGHSMVTLLVPPSLQQAHTSGFSRHLKSGKTSILGKRTEIIGMRADGSEFPLELSLSRVDIDGEPLFTAFLRDITEAKQLAEQLSHQASHDALTGLINRREFEGRLTHAISEIEDGQEHTLFYLDLDKFKIVNDTCGHAAGDELLRQLSNLIQGQIRAADTLARLGGDEFAILLRNCPLEKAMKAGHDLLDAVQQHHFSWEGQSFNTGFSIGVVPITNSLVPVSDVLCTADAACYRAKDEGRNQMHVYKPDDEELLKQKGELRWIGRIYEAFEEKRISLYYQTIAPLNDELADGLDRYEILIRMVDEDDNLIPPSAFLSAAERYNMMPTIDRWVVRNTLKWLSEHEHAAESCGLCTINLSGQSLTDVYFLEFVKERFAEYRIDAKRICFEITETAAVANLTKAIHFINELRELGCSFALDDFGSGMSSFGYLKNLPVDYLKIDGEFVRDILTDDINRAMVKSINEIGQVMGKRTIAEFVENDAIAGVLREMGVDYAQGYGIAMPCPLDNLLKSGQQHSWG